MPPHCHAHVLQLLKMVQTRVVAGDMLVVHFDPVANRPYRWCQPRMWLLLLTMPTCLLSHATWVEDYAAYCIRMKLLLLP